MLALLTRQRDMLKTERFFNTFREYVADYYISARFDLHSNYRKHPDSLQESGRSFGHVLLILTSAIFGLLSCFGEDSQESEVRRRFVFSTPQCGRRDFSRCE
jgi:hypothetical protein